MRRLRLARLGALWVGAVLLLVTSEACGPAPAASLIRTSHPTALAGSTWRLVAAGDRATPADVATTLAFGQAEVSGDAPCNGFGGTFAYVAATGALRIDGLVSTKRACVDSTRNELEASFFAGLRGVAGADDDPTGRLVLSGVGPELTFEVGPVQVGPEVTVGPSGGA